MPIARPTTPATSDAIATGRHGNPFFSLRTTAAGSDVVAGAVSTFDTGGGSALAGGSALGVTGSLLADGAASAGSARAAAANLVAARATASSASLTVPMSHGSPT